MTSHQTYCLSLDCGDGVNERSGKRLLFHSPHNWPSSSSSSSSSFSSIISVSPLHFHSSPKFDYLPPLASIFHQPTSDFHPKRVMSAIKDLLNPEPEEHPPRVVVVSNLSRPREKGRRLIKKDAALFRPGNPKGEVQYPPFEEISEEVTQILQEWKVHPLGDIDKYPRHIPYQSDKKDFQEKTGRDAFNVFHYTFQIPGDDMVWTVMWDYNIGLVRTTHLFKCNGHSKTAPGKVLGNIHGLRKICHSITGGSLAAQGYWMPYEAAKAVAATFCWKIRYVLVPLFGPDFPAQCIKPKNGSQINLSQITIDIEIVKRATETAEMYRSLEQKKGFSSIIAEGPSTKEDTPAVSEFEDSGPDSPSDVIPHRHMYPKMPRRSYADSVYSARGSSSEPSYCPSPSSPQSNSFTPVNPPCTSHPIQSVPAKRFVDQCIRTRGARMASSKAGTASDTEMSELTPPPASESGSNNDYAIAAQDLTESELSSDSDRESSDAMDEDEDYREPLYRVTKRKRVPGRLAILGKVGCEITAAHALLHLHTQQARSMNVDERGVKRLLESPFLNRSRSPVPKRRASM